MVARTLTGGDSRAELLAKAGLVFGLAVPTVLLVSLHYASRAAGIEFGNVVFALTALATLAWFLFAGWGRRMDAARPTGELFRSSATQYAEEISTLEYDSLPMPARLLVILTGTVVLGWAVLLATV